MIGEPIYYFNHLDKVYWNSLSSNPNAIPILEKNLDKVNWDWLSRNPNAIHILKKNVDKVNWLELSKNNNVCKIICKYDYKKMMDNMKDFCEDLVKYVFHPKRLDRLCEKYSMHMFDLLELL